MSESIKIAPPLTHGFRKPENTEKSWQERVFDFMDCNLETQAPLDNTATSEKGLKIPSSHYFYVMKIHRAFEHIIFIFQLNEEVTPPDLKGVSPFDSGGLWHDYHIENAIQENDKQRLFGTYNYSLCDYKTHFQQYLATAYIGTDCSPEESYVNCEEPASGWWTDSQLDLKEGNDGRAWCWEARVPYQHIKDLLELKRIYFSYEDFKQLEKEISTEKDKQKYLHNFRKLTQHYQDGLNNDLSARDLAVEYLSELSLGSSV